MRREEYCVNPTINGIKQESDYALHVLNLQKAKTVINTKPFEQPPHFKQQSDYNQKLRKDMLLQSEYLFSLIPTKENPQPHPPKARNVNEMFKFKEKHSKKASEKTKNGNKMSALPTQFFLTENQKDQIITPSSNKRPINYFDFDKESLSPTGDSAFSNQPNISDDDEPPKTESSPYKTQMKKQKQISTKFNSRYYKPERLNEKNDNLPEDSSSANDDQNNIYRFQLNQSSNENMTGIEVDDNDFNYELLFNSKNKNGDKYTPKAKSSNMITTPSLNDNNDDLLSTNKKDDSMSDAFLSSTRKNKLNPQNTHQKSKTGNDTPNPNSQNWKQYQNSPKNQLAKLDQTNSNSNQGNSSGRKTIRIKRTRTIRKRVIKKINGVEMPEIEEEEEEPQSNKPVQYTYAKTTNGKPYQILFLKPNDTLPPNSAIVQIDTTRVVAVRSASPLEFVEAEARTMPPNSLIILPNQKSLMKKFTIKKTTITSPTYSSFVVTSIDDRPLHFIYIQPDREVPPDAFLVHRENRIRIAVQGQLKLQQIKLGDPLPPNSIRTPSFINQPRRTVCIVAQENEAINFVTVKVGEEEKLPKNSVIVHKDDFLRTAVVSQSAKPLEYVSIFEGGKIPENAIVLSSNVIKKKPPKVAVFPSKSDENESENDDENHLVFMTVKNNDQIPLNSIVVESDDRKALILVPVNEKQKIQSILIGEGEKRPNGSVFVDLSLERMVPNVGVLDDDSLDVATFSNKSEIPKDSIILKDDDRVAVALVSPQNQRIRASTFEPSNEANDELHVPSNSFIIESSVNGKSAKNRVSVISPDKKPLNVITLKTVDDLPQNSAIVSIEEFDEENEEGQQASSAVKRVVAAVAPDDQPLKLVNLFDLNDKEFLKKVPKTAHFVATHENDKDRGVTDNVRFAVRAPDGSPLNVITVVSEDDVPHDAAVIKSDEKATIAVVSNDGKPLQLVTLINGEKPPKNSFVLPKKEGDHLSTENPYKCRLAVTSNDGKPLKVLTLSEKEEVPQNSMIIQSGDFGNVVAVSQDEQGIHLVTVDEDQKIPTNCIEIANSKDNKENTKEEDEEDKNKTKLCVVSPDSSPLQLVTLKHGDELPANSFVIESDEEKITAVTSPNAVQILSINEGDEIPKNAILIDDKNTQKFAFTTPKNGPLSIVAIKSKEQIPKNSKIIKSDGKTSIAVASPTDKPLLISTLKDDEKPPKNSFVFDPSNKDIEKEPKIAVFAADKQQMNIVTLKPSDDFPRNSILIQNDKEKKVAISSPNSQPLQCVSLNENEEAPPNSFVFDNTASLFAPFASTKNEEKEKEMNNYDDLNDNDYNDESESDENNKMKGKDTSTNKENENKFMSIFNDISKSLTDESKNNESLHMTQKSPRIIVESNDQSPLNFITLNKDDEIPENSIVVDSDATNGYKVCITSPTNSPLKFVAPESFDKDRSSHPNAVDITQTNKFAVSSSEKEKMTIATVKTGEKLPMNSAIISQDAEKTVAVVGDPYLKVKCLDSEEVPPNSIQPLISTKTNENTENQDEQGSEEKNKSGKIKVAVTATEENPLYLVTLKPNDQIPPNSAIIESDSEKVVYAVSPNKYPLKCQLIGQNEPVPPSSFIALNPNDTNAEKMKTKIAIYSENRRQFHYFTFLQNDEIPSNSFIIGKDENYRETIASPTNSPLCFYVLNSETKTTNEEENDEMLRENTFVATINGEKEELLNNCAVASSDDSPLCVTMVKKGEKVPNNSAIISRKGSRIVSLSPTSEFKPLLLYTNAKSGKIPENAVFLDAKYRRRVACSSKDGKQLSYTIIKEGNEAQIPTNSFIIDTEGGSNGRSLAVVASEGQRLLYIPIRNEKDERKLSKNSIIVDRDPTSEFVKNDKAKIVVRGQDSKPLKFLTINKNDELPENAIVIHSEVNGKKVILQASNKKPLQYMIFNFNEEIPKNSVVISKDPRQIDRIVVMSSSSTVEKEENKNTVKDGEKTNEPLQYVILKPNEEVPQNAAVIKREGGKRPRRLAVKSPTGHSLKYVPLQFGEESPNNSVTFCRGPTSIDSFSNNNKCDEENASCGVFNRTKKAAVAVTSTDNDKPFQYIIAKFGDRLPKNMVSLFKEGGDDARTVALNSADESSSPLLFFFVNPGGELPPNSVFLDEAEVRKSITVAPGSSADPLLDVEEVGIDEPIPENAVVVCTKKNKDGKTVRVIVKASDNSPLVPSLTRPGFEPRNAIILNRSNTNEEDQDATNNDEDILEQLNQLKELKQKRARILKGQIYSPGRENDDDDESHISAFTQTDLSAEAFMKDALERFDIYLRNVDETKPKKKTVVKRKKKKQADNNNNNNNNDTLENIEEEEENNELSTTKSNTDDNSQNINKNENSQDETNNNNNNSKNNKKNENNNNKRSDKNELDRKNSLSSSRSRKSSPHERIIAPPKPFGPPLTFGEPEIEEEEEETENIDGDGFRTPGSRKTKGSRSLVQSTKRLRKIFIGSPYEFSKETNPAKFSEDNNNNNNTVRTDEKTNFTKPTEENNNNSTVETEEKSSPNKTKENPSPSKTKEKSSSDKTKEKSSPGKIYKDISSPSLLTQKYNKKSLIDQDVDPVDHGSNKSSPSSNKSRIITTPTKRQKTPEQSVNYGIQLSPSSSTKKRNKSNESESNNNNSFASEVKVNSDDPKNLGVSVKTFTYSPYYKNEMDETKNKYKKIPFSKMTPLIQPVDNELIQSSRASVRTSSMKSSAATSRQHSPRSSKSPKPPKPPSSNATPKSSRLPENPNSVRFV